jgi:hypothetical protein
MANLALKQVSAPASSPSPDEAVAVLCGKVTDGSRRLADFVTRNPRLSRERGLDVASMQLQGIVDRERLDEVQKICAMGTKGRRMPLDPGLAVRLGNAERILDDAVKEMVRTGVPSAAADAVEPGLGQQEEAGLGLSWIPFAVIGVAAVGVVLLMSKKKGSEPAKELPSFERKA